MEAALILTAVPDRRSAAKLAGVLVRGRLAACVSCLPAMRSTYRWKGRIESASEHLLIAKTSGRRCAEAERTLRRHHPYEVPEIVRLRPAAVDKPYLRWLLDSVASPPARKRRKGL